MSDFGITGAGGSPSSIGAFGDALILQQRQIDSIDSRVERMSEAELDQTAEINMLHVALQGCIDAVRRLGRLMGR